MPKRFGLSPTHIVLTGRGLRAFGDGFVALLLPAYLTRLGFSALQVGVFTTATLLGSAALTLAVGFVAHRVAPRRILFGASLLLLATGLSAALFRDFWPLVLVGVVGTLNPSGGDVTAFVPLEHAVLAHAGPDAERTNRFAHYSLVASFVGAGGALAAAIPDLLLHGAGISSDTSIRALFVAYGCIGVLLLALYQGLPTRDAAVDTPAPAPLGPSRGKVIALAALFSLDSFAGGFLAQSLMALWLFTRFGLSLAAAGAFFFWSGLLSALSFLAAAAIARRIGLVRTMVFTHIPSSLCLLLVVIAPNITIAMALLLVRAALSQMDVPTRTSYVMAIVTPQERGAAASFTAVPRSLAAAISPAISGWLMGVGAFAWPLLLCGGLKIVYDLLLLFSFGHIKPPEETPATETAKGALEIGPRRR